ncbi:arylamine N-acetyltransferase family protein [Actinopolyspora mortivallis]|uniref:Acetyltransferase n=1 Tax=Actinopolyspora mortivallis TaxID=33906 RepID=A0A2T0GW50_ACTMO|nr:arylamine N-acetyltransferase [Actinopolyspora mortivallis]PRW63341.1 acetyltransferase [Actinopolyspora mortivallis]
MSITENGETQNISQRSPWGIEDVDVDAYFARIGYEGPRDTSVDTLRRLHRLHLAAISFETVDIGLEIYTPITVSFLQEKFVKRGRGGCCVEHNLLFAAVLEALGFNVRRYLGRVRRGDSTTVRFRSHATLVVEAEGRHFLADVGFGDEGPLFPVPFAHDGRITVGEWTWRLVHEDEDRDVWLLQSLHPDGWFDVYAFGTETVAPVDMEVSFYYTATNPRSVFTGHITAQRGEDNVRHVLRDHTLRTLHPDGRKEEELLTTEQVLEQLRERFLITLSEEETASVREYLNIER